MRRWCVVLLCLYAGFVQAQSTEAAADEVTVEDASQESAAQVKDVTQGEYVTLTTALASRLNGFVAGPEDASVGILVLHDRWGFNDTVRGWVQRFAKQGYRALAIDVFDRRASDKPWLAEEIMNSTDPEAIKINLKAGVAYLQAPGRKLVTFGAGHGGWQSLQATLAAPDRVAGTIFAYGDVTADVAQVRSLKGALLGLFGEHDELVTEEMADAFRVVMRKSLAGYRSITYAAGHGFLDPAYHTYNEALAVQAWQEIDGFIVAVGGQRQGQ